MNALRTMTIMLILSAGFCATAAAARAGDLLIEHVTLIDGTARPALKNASVLVRGARITRIARGAIMADHGVRRIDGRGKYLIPGMMDVHIHLRGASAGSYDGKTVPAADLKAGTQALQSYLYSGITTLLDVGNNPDFIFALRDQERAGKIAAPRLFAVGGIVTYPGSHGSGAGATLVEDWPEAIPALDAHIARHPDMLKLTLEERGWGARPMIPMLPVDLMQHIIAYYNDHGIRTTAHTSSELRARQAIFAGIDTLAHPVIQGPISDKFALLMGAKKIPMATTLTIGDNYGRLVDHPEFLDQPLYRAVLTKAQIHQLKTTVRDAYAKRRWTKWMQVMTPVAQENIRKINAAGGVLALGTDQSIGPAAHRELELITGAGISNADAIRIATLNAAVFLGKERDLGSIEEGKIADMVLLDADPLADINNAKAITMVIKNGKIIDRAALDLPVNHQDKP